MPQFDPAVIAPQVVWLVITFGLLYLLMARLVLPSIGRVLEERVERVAENLDQAESLKRESEQVRDARDALLADARARAAAAIGDATARARKDGEDSLARLDAELADKIAEAEAGIRKAQSGVLGEVESVAAETCRDMIARLVGDEVAVTRARQAVLAVTRGGNAS